MNKYFISSILISSLILIGCQATPPAEDPESPPLEPIDASFDSGNFEVDYSDKITATEDADGRLTLSHTVPHEHLDPCDFRDGAATLSEITDFEVVINSHENLEQALKTNNDSFAFEEYFSEGELRIEPGFIDQFATDNLSGYRITSNVENCGTRNYYFVDDGEVISAMHPFSELEADLSLQEVPGVIQLEEAHDIFMDILASLRS